MGGVWMKAFEERLHSGGLGVCRAFEGECVKLRVCMAFEGRLHTSGLCVCMTFEGRLKDHAKTILFVGLEGEPPGSILIVPLSKRRDMASFKSACVGLSLANFVGA
jgi:hypothetical protein